MAGSAVFVVCLLVAMIGTYCVRAQGDGSKDGQAGDTSQSGDTSKSDNATKSGDTAQPNDHPSAPSEFSRIRVKVLVQPPFVQHSSTSQGKFEGLFIDILEEMTKRANLTYTVQPQEDNRYGYEMAPGNFTGIVGSVQNNEADLAVAPLTVNSVRHNAVAFTYPILQAGLRILYKVPPADSTGEAFTVLLSPFTPGLWVLLLLMFIVVSVVMYVIGRFSPYEDHAFVGKAATYEGLTFINSFLYVFSSLTFQGYTAAPRSMSGRVMAAVWWMFTLLVIAAYTASLAAIFLAIKPSVRSLPFATFDELSKQSQVAYGIVKGGSTEFYLKNSDRQPQKRLWSTIIAHGESLMASSQNDGIMRVSKSDGDYALIIDGPLAEYYAGQPPCTLMAIGEPLSEHTYAFACNSTKLCHQLNEHILAMMEDEFIYQTKEKWLHHGCRTDDTAEYIFQGLPFFDTFGGEPEYYASRTVTLRRFGVAFLLLLIGIVISTCVLIGEIFYAKRRGTAVPQRLPRTAGDDQERIDKEFRDEEE